MPRVRYLGGGGYYLHDGPDFEDAGDEGDVGERTADRLTRRDDFELVDGGDEDGGSGTLPNANNKMDEMLIEAGECPWCDEYEGENVGMHASRAHPDAWTDYNEAN